MTTNDAILTLEIEAPYIGSAVSPTVDITETTDDVTVTITDYQGEHSYTVEKTNSAIADAEQATQNANAAASSASAAASGAYTATTSASRAASRATSAADDATNAAETANAAATSATTAASDATDAATAATSAAASADDATERANTAIAGINQTGNQVFSQVMQAKNEADAAATSANTAATAANEAATAATTAAEYADTATAAANLAAETANTAASAADTARENIQADLAAKADSDGYHPAMRTGAADTVTAREFGDVTFMQRASGAAADTVATVEAVYGNTIVKNDELISVDIRGIESVGFNQWDGVSSSAHFNYTTGNFDTQGGWTCTSKIKALPNTVYYIAKNGASTTFIVGCWDSQDNYLGSSMYSNGNREFTTKPGTAYIRAEWTGAAGDICINLSDPALNGTYAPYERHVRELDTSQWFPTDMKSAGSVHDELDMNRAIARVGTRAYESGDENDATLTTDGATWTNYPLATPTVTPIDPPLNMSIQVAHGGTERIVTAEGAQSAPPTLRIGYNATPETIRDDVLSCIAQVEPTVATSNHAAGTYLVHDGTLYKVTSAIATGETITPGTNVTATTVMAELLALTS